jgi:transcription-repair coupling factor (superfamily II helicase)
MKKEIMNTIFSTIKRHIGSGQSGLITGITDAGQGFLLSGMQEVFPRIVTLVASEKKAYDLKRNLQAFAADEPELFLAHDFVFTGDTPDAADVQRMKVLQRLSAEKAGYHLITTPGSWLHLILDRKRLEANSVLLNREQEWAAGALVTALTRGGYHRAGMVTAPGEMAVRGGIVDLFPISADSPFRIEFFGDLIESIRRFDPEDQRSIEEVEQLVVLPASEREDAQLPAARGKTNTAGTLFDYLAADTVFFLDEPEAFYQEYKEQSHRLVEYFKVLRQENRDFKPAALLPLEQLQQQLAERPVLYHAYFSSALDPAALSFSRQVACREMEPFFRHYEALTERIKEWQAQGCAIFILIDQPVFLENMRAFLLEHGITGVTYRQSALEKGFISADLKAAVITEFDLRGKSSITVSPPPPGRSRTPALLLEDLKIGEYVVHEHYGIGLFHGVTYDTIDGVTKEYLLLQYAGSDKLYLPMEKLALLHRYSGVGETTPRLNKLGGSEWDRTRKKVVKAVQDMADDLIRLYAARQKIGGFAFAPDTAWQRQFEDDFPYQETPGQLSAVADVKRDMESSRPMDRLVCGDVGYGKTEVAMRAVFKALMNGKQAAVLVPTTILAEQHHHNFVQRFANYPAEIAVLSRFRKPAEQKQTLQGLKSGSIDIVVATHRLLSKDVVFHDLGLLVVDEEHRFGVAQKEKIKALRQQVDVLSLSATPIPRSLHMAMTGIRDLSVIDTPPPNRYPVTTQVMAYDPEIIREAIRFELRRGGQVFFVHNRVRDILRIRTELEHLVPEAKIALGHGQMPEAELESAILDFQAQKFDIFLCTTIIESGLDMPNVNTLIVHQADHMGLAQLYQLRGRVGRSETMAYAYITYQPEKSVSETAQKRLSTLRDFNELGSGIKIALRDLEIRGAGNLLGAEQHGHIHAVGFDLYCRILEEETNKLKGTPTPEIQSIPMDIDLDFYIPENYIADSGARLRMYRQLLLASGEEDIAALQQEMEDRFGPAPDTVRRFLQIARLRVLAQNKQIKGLRRKRGNLYLTLDFDRMVELAQQDWGRRVKVMDADTLCIELGEKPPLETLDELEKIIALI